MNEVQCPFCAGKIFVMENQDHVDHTVPPCKVFLETDDAMEFVTKCNDHLARLEGPEAVQKLEKMRRDD